MLLTLEYPKPIPPPSVPICPNIEARVIPIHKGCSPAEALCRLHEIETIVFFAEISFANHFIVSTGIEVMFEAHSGVHGLLFFSPKTYDLNSLKPLVYSSINF